MRNRGSNNMNEMNFELNLLPVFNVFAACICFLLATAVWIHIGSIDFSQALGGQSLAESKPVPSVWTYLQKDGSVILVLKELSQSNRQSGTLKLKSENGSIQWSKFQRQLGQISKKHPEVKTALIVPDAQTKYDDLIKAMDSFRSVGIKNLGVSPL